MDRLPAFYEQLRKLRESGIKMKDLAEELDLTSSVLSSLYTSVLPTYMGQISTGKSNDEALDIALQQVNNVSKRKLLGSIGELYEKAMHIEPRFVANNGRPFFEEIEKEAIKYIPNANVYSGFYLAYSRSSFCDGLKVEPYLISTLADGETMPRVYCQNISGEYYTGTGIFSPCQVGYLLFNEQKRLQLALKVIYLQLPMLEHPRLITGLYLTHDYSRNPIARRILLIRQDEEISLEEFAKLRTEVVPRPQLTDALLPYYDYTCQHEDTVRSLMMAFPGNGLDSLIAEKQMLGIL